ncbi:MAG: sigma-70 family RNA polymerase sigma factor [Anaerovoracaceae bacterium]|jgi:RNA polymerase sporulation-specific sigma factor
MADDFSARSDEELVRMAQQGNREAEEYLIRAYGAIVRRQIRGYFIMGAETEDLYQEALIGLLKAIQTYAPGRDTAFRTYAELCIHRQILDAMRAASRKKHEPLNTSVSLNKPVKSSSPQTLEEILPAAHEEDPETSLVIEELIAYISANREGTFSELERQVWKQYMEGKSYREIAAALDKNQKSVYNAMERMKRKIIAFLQER